METFTNLLRLKLKLSSYILRYEKNKRLRGFKKKLAREAADHNWGLYCNVKLDIAQYFETERNDARSALDQYIDLLYLDINGPVNNHSIQDNPELLREYPDFEPKRNFVAPATAVTVRRILEKEGISQYEYKALFLTRGEILYKTLKLPVDPESAWDTMSENIKNARLSKDKDVYGNLEVSLSDCENTHILKWWTKSHDELIKRQIEKYQWFWHVNIAEEIINMTPEIFPDKWQTKDPLCASSNWYNILTNFSVSHAEKLRFTKAIRKPKIKECALCKKDFAEDSLSFWIIKNLGMDQIDFCGSCLQSSESTYDNSFTKQETLTYIKKLSSILQQIPPQDFGIMTPYFSGLSTEKRLEVFEIVKRRPTVERIEELFGSWLNALICAGILENGTRRTARGTQCLAKDGHVCLSLGEKIIDDLLYSLGISHDKEPHYPDSMLRADFLVNGAFIEYFGLTGNAGYDEKTKAKQELCLKYGIKLISLYPKDLVSSKEIESILQELR
ncbi:MAG TPA: hypothetical protein PK263_01320 [bacterium]|nr:hypothetical protein [bacterium]